MDAHLFNQQVDQDKVYVFTEAQKEKIRLAGSHPTQVKGLDRLIEYYEQTGKLPAFACGSLITYSHLESVKPDKDGTRNWKEGLGQQFPDIDPDKLFSVQRARLPGYVRDFVCYDVFYRGKVESPGVTFGLDEREGESAYGAIVHCDVGAQISDPQIAADFAAFYLQEFFKREYPSKMPIYRFELKDAELEDGGVIPGIACVADKDAVVPGTDIALYAGGLSFQERAQILASAFQDVNPDTGEPKKLGMMTDLDYVRFMIHCSMEVGIAVDPELIDIYTLAVHIRDSLPQEQKNFLQSIEEDGAHNDAVLKFTGVIKQNGFAKKQRNVPSEWNLQAGTSSPLALKPEFDL